MTKNELVEWENLNEAEVEGGWKIIKGEVRFVPLKIKRVAHCISCLYFNRQYQSCSQGYECWEFTETCEKYVNRTHKSRR